MAAEHMKTLIYEVAGGLSTLNVSDIPIPRPKNDEILVKVRACSLNVADYNRFRTKNGRIPVTTELTNHLMGYPGKPLGSAISGIVMSVGKNAGTFRPGDAVYGQTSGTGGLAEFAVLGRDNCCLMPGVFSFEEASTVPLSFEVALGAVRKAGIGEGDHVMVYGASGGVGLFAAQLAKIMGARVTGVCSTRNIAAAKGVGCDRIIDYKKENFAKVSEQFDAILGINGHNPMKLYKRLLSPNGIFVGVGDTKQGMSAILASLYSKSFGFYIQPVMKQKGYLQYARNLAEEGKLQPVVGGTFPVKDVSQVIEAVLRGQTKRRMVLKVNFEKDL